MPNFIDLTGKKIGRWFVLVRVQNNRHKHPQFMCRCDCGTEKIVDAQLLRTGKSQSCGCYNKDIHRSLCRQRNIKHGYSRPRSKVYITWQNMLQRCNNPSNTGYKNYGAKGISVCQSWHNFEHFLLDMGEPPSDKHTIERLDSSGDYEPRNCIWATQQTQQNNRSNNRIIECDGQKMTLQNWSRITGISRETISKRIDMGWPVKLALSINPCLGRNQHSKRK